MGVNQISSQPSSRLLGSWSLVYTQKFCVFRRAAKISSFKVYSKSSDFFANDKMHLMNILRSNDHSFYRFTGAINSRGMLGKHARPRKIPEWIVDVCENFSVIEIVLSED